LEVGPCLLEFCFYGNGSSVETREINMAIEGFQRKQLMTDSECSKVRADEMWNRPSVVLIILLFLIPLIVQVVVPRDFSYRTSPQSTDDVVTVSNSNYGDFLKVTCWVQCSDTMLWRPEQVYVNVTLVGVLDTRFTNSIQLEVTGIEFIFLCRDSLYSLHESGGGHFVESHVEGYSKFYTFSTKLNLTISFWNLYLAMTEGGDRLDGELGYEIEVYHNQERFTMSNYHDPGISGWEPDQLPVRLDSPRDRFARGLIPIIILIVPMAVFLWFRMVLSYKHGGWIPSVAWDSPNRLRSILDSFLFWISPVMFLWGLAAISVFVHGHALQAISAQIPALWMYIYIMLTTYPIIAAVFCLLFGRNKEELTAVDRRAVFYTYMAPFAYIMGLIAGFGEYDDILPEARIIGMISIILALFVGIAAYGYWIEDSTRRKRTLDSITWDFAKIFLIVFGTAFALMFVFLTQGWL
jgi:hypothetical protein